MVALFNNPEDATSIPVECVSFREVEGVKIISDESDEYILPEGLVGKNCTFTSYEIMDYAGVGISVFTFKRDYCNG